MHLGIGATSPTVCLDGIYTRRVSVAPRLVVHCPSLPSHQSGRLRPVESPRSGKCGIESRGERKGYGLYSIARGESERRAEKFIHSFGVRPKANSFLPQTLTLACTFTTRSSSA